VLAIDAGNTRVKWALDDDAGWRAQGAVATARAEDLGAALAPLPAPERVVVANVAGAAVAEHIDAAAARWGVAPRYARSAAAQCGVISSYDDPAQLGPDRWAALIGAWHLYARASVVVNAGTALTVDALSGEGVFLGGLIVPGLALMHEALARNTAGLPLARGEFRYFPANTDDAIASGAINAACGAIERIARFLAETAGEVPLVVLSGGSAAALAPQLAGEVATVDNLVLEGLAHIAREE
jgi:type III pantothenate kinase